MTVYPIGACCPNRKYSRMFSKEDAMRRVPVQDGFIVTGVRGETPRHWVIDRTAVVSDLDVPVPLVHKHTGVVTMALPHVDRDLFVDFAPIDGPPA